ncbi:hypothetical protein Q5752_005719 [Cryptotrichosporon argae]
MTRGSVRPSKGTPVDTSSVVPKLLVLDLNGALVHRSAHTGNQRKSYPRPYLRCFLEYLFLPDPPGTEYEEGARPWNVFVWSSAQPHNVRRMVEDTFGHDFVWGVWEEEDEVAKAARLERGEGRLLGVWARDMMGLASHDYNRKVQTTKDLRKVIAHLDDRFDEKTTVLLDDSPLKAVQQPWSQIVIPEYDAAAHRTSKAAAASPNLDGIDETLLAVVGVLDALRKVDNVPAWVRAGGLVRRELELQPVKPAHLPSAEDFAHWYADPEVFQVWVEAGIKALAHKNIELEHGVVRKAPDRARSSHTHSPEMRPCGGWSPSRPAETRDEVEPVSPPTANKKGADSAPSWRARQPQKDPGSSCSEPKGERRPAAADVAVYLEHIAEGLQADSGDRHVLRLAAGIVVRVDRDGVRGGRGYLGDDDDEDDNDDEDEGVRNDVAWLPKLPSTHGMAMRSAGPVTSTKKEKRQARKARGKEKRAAEMAARKAAAGGQAEAKDQGKGKGKGKGKGVKGGAGSGANTVPQEQTHLG